MRAGSSDYLYFSDSSRFNDFRKPALQFSVKVIDATTGKSTGPSCFENDISLYTFNHIKISLKYVPLQ